MTQLIARIANREYELHSASTGIIWTGDDGWGMPSVRRITDRGPMQHGDSDLDFRLEPRIGMLKLLLRANTHAEHWQRRSELLRILQPSRTPIQLLWRLDNGDERAIDVHVVGGAAMASGDRFGRDQHVVVQLRAADPTFYDPSGVGETFGVGAGGSGWVFPLSFPGAFGSNIVDQTRQIDYTGSWETFPVIIINGPITSPAIENLTTGNKLRFPGVTIASGNNYTINLAPGVKTVTDASGNNKIAELSDDSNLATFSLQPDPIASNGVNDIRVTGTAANALTEVYLQWHVRYIGI